MSLFKKISLIAAPFAAIIALSGCASPFRADVARFQQMPAPQGQTFAVVADDPELSGGLEFSRYADLVAGELSQFGYVRASDPGSATLIVRLDYDVDRGREKIRSTGFYHDPFFYRPYGFHHHGQFIHGFHDPFLFGPRFADIDSYTVYTSDLTMKIDRAGDGKRLFEGTAMAQSSSNKLTYLVPNLIEAMFTNFPGQSGETVRISIAPEKK